MLFRSRESWAHSLFEDMIDAEGSEEVDVTTLSRLLRGAIAESPGHDVVLKLNVEGAAGDILFAVPPAELEAVVEVHLDHEPGSPHPVDAILGHLAGAGLTCVSAHLARLFEITRPGADG